MTKWVHRPVLTSWQMLRRRRFEWGYKNPALSGVYHLAAAGETSWHGYARFVIDFARQADVEIQVTPEAILPVSSSAFATAAKRPLNSRLNTDKIQSSFNLQLPHWQSGVTRMLTEILEKS